MPEKVVTRFAPSPTGYLHVGGARTALFNWLWARRNNGLFILRIEDTDQKRNTPTAMQQVIDDLKWLGITWDEGPEVGGPHGPYLQSQRLDIYERYIRQLLDQGKAYYCFETPEELEAKRKAAEAQKQGFIYRRPECLPDADDVAQARAQGRPVTVRFAIPQDQAIVVRDRVRGEVTFSPDEIADFIIQKSDSFPTYNYACVVDDYLMGITHVIRGQEHLNNTPGQLCLWQALFGTESLPQYAHMSVTISEGRGKLSKRERPKALKTAIQAMPDIDLDQLAQVGDISRVDLDQFLAGKTIPDMPSIDAMAEHLGVTLPEINVVDFMRSGYLPETMVNFLALLGWNPGDDREVMSQEELIQAFDIERLTKSNSLFDRPKLMAFNTEHMRMLPVQQLVRYLRHYLEQTNSPLTRADDATLEKLLHLCEGARTLADIHTKCRFAFVDNDNITYDIKAVNKVLLKGNGLEMLALVYDRLAALESFTEQDLEAMLRELAEKKQVSLGKVAQPLRVAICGTTISPAIFDSMNMLGKENTLERIHNTLTRFGSSS